MAAQDRHRRDPFREPGFNRTASLPLAVDGRFGPKTDGRVRDFQGRNKLTPDGTVGPLTRQAIKSQAQILQAA